MKTRMRTLICGVCMFVFICKMNAQGIVFSPVLANPNPNAMLDVISNGAVGKGVLFPRITNTQRTIGGVSGGLINAGGNLYGGAAKGLLVYQSDSANGNEFGIYYNISATSTPQWIHAANGSSNDWADSGNISTNTNNNFIGTIDGGNFIVKVNSTASSSTGAGSVMTLNPATFSPVIIRGWNGNTALNNASGETIFGGGFAGNQQTVTDSFNVIMGGAGNIAGNGNGNSGDAKFAFAGGGYHNFALKNYSSVIGGQLNSINGDYSFNGGGASNIVDAVNSSIGGGTNNYLPTGYFYSSILGGANNSIHFSSSVIFGGENNAVFFITSAGPQASPFILGGKNNIAARGIVAGGKNDSSYAFYSTVLGGSDNKLSLAQCNLIFGNGATNSSATDNTIIFNHPNSGDGKTRFGLGNNNPQTSVDDDEALAVRPLVTTWNSGSAMSLTPGNRTFYVFEMDDLPANRTLNLSATTVEGQVFYILVKSQTNNLSHGVTISGPVIFSGVNTFTTNTLIELILSNGNYYEISRSLN